MTPPTSVLTEFELARDFFKTPPGPERRTPPILPPSWRPLVTERFGCLEDSDQPNQTPASSTAPLWMPLPGPQTLALNSPADELFYGGAAGGGKTDLLLGLAFTQHERSIIFRREFKQLRGIIERSREIVGQRGRLNEQTGIWRVDDRMVELGAVEHEHDKDKYQGRPHALKAFDELPQFTESQYRFLMGWNRSTNPRERIRVVGNGNPPTSTEGEWVIERWGPWLDPQHPNPAEPGELRWYAQVDGKEIACASGDTFTWQGETIYPRSRTFLPARVADNPYLMATGYISTLQGLPEPLRSQMLYGDFSIGLTDAPWQVIPTSWVREAQARWAQTPPTRPDGTYVPQSSCGVDIAEGGKDDTVIVKRRGNWIALPEITPGSQIPDANENARLVRQALTSGGWANIDSDFIGAATYHLLRATLGSRVRAFKGSGSTDATDRSGVLTFANVRAAAYWHLRELLDPTHKNALVLPPGRRVLAELTAPRWIDRGGKIILEKKDDIKERLGRSPDVGDAIAMACWDDPNAGIGQAFSAAAVPDVAALSPQEARLPWNRERTPRIGGVGLWGSE